MADSDDDVIPGNDLVIDEPKYPWFQRQAPGLAFTFTWAALFFVATFVFYRLRVRELRTKFGTEWKGSLRICAMISAYMDNYQDPRFAIMRLCTKSFLFLGFLQIGYHFGFWVMWGALVVESSLDTIRVLLAFWNCGSLENVSAVSEEEARDMRMGAKLVPTNVYEDLTRPKSIAIMVFLVQGMLIGLVMDDSYRTTTRTCFNGTDGCPMLTSLGSYCLYLMGTFMACVFYVGPRNSYGQKEQNPTFWLKLFLMIKQSRSVFTWKDPVTEQTKTLELERNDWTVWLRFVLSFLINGIGFHFLLHVLPIQVASQSAIIGVVFRAIGMIYLADLDDCTGSTMTLVPQFADNGAQDYGSSAGGDRLDAKELEEEKQKIIEAAMKDVQAKLEALAHDVRPYQSARSNSKIESITQALFRATRRRKESHGTATEGEKTPLV